MKWPKIEIVRENGQKVFAQAPLIISASRSTDIPAAYADWFFHRLKVGYSAWTNPFNGAKHFVSYQNAKLIVFWSKNPRPLIEPFNHLDYLKERNINCYIQYTLNDYEKEGLEKGVPPLSYRIDTFKKLVDKIGFGKVLWRFDPLIMTDKIDICDLLGKIENIGNQLKGYTDKLIFSYADITLYKGVKSRLEKNNIQYREFQNNDMICFAKQLSELNKNWNFNLATCGEPVDLSVYGIEHNRCIDDRLIIKYFNKDKDLMRFLGYPEKYQTSLFGEQNPNKDKGQREFCGCVFSKDIGEYDTCPHQCDYCYANRRGKNVALANYHRIKEQNNLSETITGI